MTRMSDEEFTARRDQLLAEEFKRGVQSWFYLSYADDDGFRGGCYVQAFGPVSAALYSKLNGISPGGQVYILLIPQEEEHRLPPMTMRYRLLSLAEMQAHEPMVNLEGEEPQL